MKNETMIMESLEYVEDHLYEPLSLSAIALSAGYLEYHFARLFKESMGMPVMEYVKKRRLIKASDDIIKGERIIDAALNCGYQSHSGFTKVFKQEFGFSPSFLKAMIMQMDYMGGKAMEHIFLRQTEKNAGKEELFDILKEEMARAGISYDCGELNQMYCFACKVYEGVRRYSGDEYVTHPLNTAIILAQMGADDQIIYAGMLCDALEKTGMSQNDMKGKIPDRVWKILADMKVSDVQETGDQENEEIVMINLAARLHNMRTIEFMDEQSQKIKSRETIKQFLPLAKRLKNDKLVSELNDLSLKYM